MPGRETLQEVTKKLRAFCAARERCHSEVRTKLLTLKVFGDDLEEIISQLITEGFLSDERFARHYVSGKFRINKWGRNKIIHGLRGKKIADYSIQKGLQEIDEAEYIEMLDNLLRRQVKGELTAITRQKIVASLARKGFEQALIYDRLRMLKSK